MRLDAPLVDPVAGMVYAFLGNDGIGNSAVIQLPTQVSSTKFSNQDCGTEAVIGTGGSGVPVFAGTFDNAYFTSSNGSSPSGNLYVCGNTSGDPTLYQVPISGNAMGTVGTVTAVTTAATTCSPVTEVYNSTNDFIFLSADTQGSSPTCGGSGCVYSTNITPWQRSTAYAVGQEILDTNFRIEVVETAAGTSGGTAPTWGTTTGGTKTDGTVTWLNQGLLSTIITAPAFALFTNYGLGAQVIDSNGNIELCTTGSFGCESFSLSLPSWATAPGATTNTTLGTW